MSVNQQFVKKAAVPNVIAPSLLGGEEFCATRIVVSLA